MARSSKPTKTRRGAPRPAPRSGKVERNTTETQIKAALALDGTGRYRVRTGIRFLDHMLELFAKHGGFDLELNATGDLDVDQHHTVEDVGIVLGDCLREALGDKRGINRAGYFVMPMDETLAVAAIDLSGRPYLVCDARFAQPRIGDLQSELVEDFFQGFATHAAANVHLKVLYGRSTHHAAEALFKALARALKMAVSRDARLKNEMPSTKGTAMIYVVDYGAGNLRSVENALKYVGAEYLLTSRASDVAEASAILLPGVGHFGQMMRSLDMLGLIPILRLAIQSGVPYLGICLGLHALFEGSEEAPSSPGLGLLRGTVRRFPEGLKVPHMGWNRLQVVPGTRLFEGIEDSPFAYFAHSYYIPTEETPSQLSHAAALSEYGSPFIAALETGNILGFNFTRRSPATPD